MDGLNFGTKNQYFGTDGQFYGMDGQYFGITCILKNRAIYFENICSLHQLKISSGVGKAPVNKVWGLPDVDVGRPISLSFQTTGEPALV